MDKGDSSKRWVLVDEGEDALLLNSSVSVSTDSDQDSDGSISIISDYLTENNSEEEHEAGNHENQVPDLDTSSVDSKSTIVVSNDDSNRVDEVVDNIDAVPNETVIVDKQTQANIITTTLETQTNSNLTLEKTSQTVAPRDPQYQGIIGYGLIASFLVLIVSYFLQLYTDQVDSELHTSYKQFEPQNERENSILVFCIDKNKFRGDRFDTAMAKCISKRLRKMEKEDGVKKTRVYLEIKEKLLDLREKELARKEKELAKALNSKGKVRPEKWQKKTSNSTITKYKKGKSNQTINGQWYFQLSNSRFEHRKKGKASEGYLKKGGLRENKRNKAKWYFNYMSNRDDSRVFYS